MIQTKERRIKIGEKKPFGLDQRFLIRPEDKMENFRIGTWMGRKRERQKREKKSERFESYQIDGRLQEATDGFDLFVSVMSMMSISIRIVFGILSDPSPDLGCRFHQVLTRRVVLELIDKDLNDLVLLLALDDGIEQEVLLRPQLRQLRL